MRGSPSTTKSCLPPILTGYQTSSMVGCHWNLLAVSNFFHHFPFKIDWKWTEGWHSKTLCCSIFIYIYTIYTAWLIEITKIPILFVTRPTWNRHGDLFHSLRQVCDAELQAAPGGRGGLLRVARLMSQDFPTVGPGGDRLKKWWFWVSNQQLLALFYAILQGTRYAILSRINSQEWRWPTNHGDLEIWAMWEPQIQCGSPQKTLKKVEHLSTPTCGWGYWSHIANAVAATCSRVCRAYSPCSRWALAGGRVPWLPWRPDRSVLVERGCWMTWKLLGQNHQPPKWLVCGASPLILSHTHHSPISPMAVGTCWASGWQLMG